nr:indole-3-glycerol-phosphate synthase TrpC [Gammaproteobacteria bacterium]
HLAQHIPDHILKIAESSIKTPNDIKKINQAGFDAVLIGEALVTAEKPAVILAQMRGVLCLG